MTEVTPEMVRLKLSQLGLVLSPEINYRLETMFPRLDGKFLDRSIRKQFQLIKQTEPLMQEMLLENEQVLFVTKGKIEYLKSIVVLTNLRMFCTRADRKGVPRQPFWFLYYTQAVDLKKIDSFIPGIRLKDGGKVNFQGFPDKDRKMIASVSQNAVKFLEDKGIDPLVSQSRENMCGNCFEVVPKNKYECDACGSTFWEPFEVGIRSFIFPSWGGFAMKNYGIACGELFSFLFVLIGFIISLAHGEFIIAGLMLAITIVSDAVITFNIAAKGLYLKQLPDND